MKVNTFKNIHDPFFFLKNISIHCNYLIAPKHLDRTPQPRLYNDYPTCSKRHGTPVNQRRLYMYNYFMCSKRPLRWNTLGSRCSNVAGSLGLSKLNRPSETTPFLAGVIHVSGYASFSSIFIKHPTCMKKSTRAERGKIHSLRLVYTVDHVA